MTPGRGMRALAAAAAAITDTALVRVTAGAFEEEWK